MRSLSRPASFLYIALVYAVALAVAWLVLRAVGHHLPLIHAIAAADVAATVAVFAGSVLADNTSVYDPYWSVAPIAIAPVLATHNDAFTLRMVLVTALVTLWGLRLTYNWARGFGGLHHEDWRYVDIRHKTGRGYWPASFAALHLFPTVQVFLGCLPFTVALTSLRPLGWLDGVAALVTLSAIAIEAIADEQLRAFRAEKREGEIMARGLWSKVRHPNYAGEIGFWWGLFLFALAADPGALWTGIGALAITVMFVLASIPMIDKRSIARRPAYAEHMKRVPALLPKLFG